MNLFTRWWLERLYQRHLLALCNAHRARIGAPLLTRI